MQTQIFKQSRFLIVDDEPANISVLTQMLEKWGATQIVSTTDPRATEQLFHSYHPDIILLDLTMPKMSGFEVMAQLIPQVPADSFLPILVLTADTTGRAKRRALEHGAADFLTKPFDAAELSLRVKNLLTTRLLQCRLQDQNAILEEKVQERTSQLLQAELDTLDCLAMAAEYRDDDTGKHTQRVGHIAGLIASELGIDPERATLILRAAPLHDIGKIGIADGVLLKPGKLTDDEFEIMKTHTIIGAKIMSKHHTPLLQLASVIALTHHERFDGSGYPSELGGEAIPLEGRIVAVADVFDALSHKRSYKEAWTEGDSLAEIEAQSGKQFDPQVVKAFLAPMQDFLDRLRN